MRFADRITFVSTGEPIYDPINNQYIEGEERYDIVPCKLTPLGMERTQQLFGTLDKRITAAITQHPYRKKFDFVKINNKRYEVTASSDYRKGVFYLEGDFE